MNMLSVLLVEDDPITCNEFINYLEEEEEISLIGVTDDSNKAIDYVKDFLPDAIILDLELHKGSGNGLSVLQGLKYLDLYIPPYVLITTNNSSQITYDSVRYFGADFIMSKHQTDYSAKNVIDFLKIMKPTLFSRKQQSAATSSPTESPAVKSKRIIHRINTELNYVGINPNAIGYQYLVDAIYLVIKQPLHNLCNIISEKYGKTEASVERAMQNAINKAWRSTDIDDLLKYYKARINSEKGVPTLTEFIYYYANKIKNEYV